MKAPNKIYIQTNAGKAFSSKWTTIPFRDFENTEYISKDALIKWAKEKLSSLKDLLDTDPYNEAYIGKCEVLKELMDKLNSL